MSSANFGWLSRVAEAPYLGSGLRPLSGRFWYAIVGGREKLEFRWDGAAIGEDGSIVLVEKELTRPVVLHIQGHVARAAFMVAAGDPVRKLVWVVRKHHFRLLWFAAERWRLALRNWTSFLPPPCEYWTPEGECLAVSPDYR